MTVKTMAASVHDKGKRVHITPDAHERQETNTTLHQHLLFVLVTDISPRENRRADCLRQLLKAERLTFSLLMVTVASATLRATGVQSSLLEEPTKLSMAPFSMSIPAAQDVRTKQVNE